MKTRENTTTLVLGVAATTTSWGDVPPVSFVVYGKVVSMKNRRRLLKNRKTGKLFSAKSSDAVKYATDFLLQVPQWAKLSLGSPTAPLSVRLMVYHVDLRSDLSCDLVYDCLQAAGVIANDRHIRHKEEWLRIDAKTPRVEIEIRQC